MPVSDIAHVEFKEDSKCSAYSPIGCIFDGSVEQFAYDKRRERSHFSKKVS
jgi:hypothetical protein